MSELLKSSLTVDGNSVHLSMPFSKVDKEKRLVSGYATLDNLDTQGDVVLAEASKKAFARARGNIREMHQPLAVGTMVDFREDEFFHAGEDGEGKFYRGIYVTARVSEGAESTWLKVLDGTLSGFSIGGEINEATNQFVKEAGRTVRFIEDYDLVELSLVDNPANQLANINSIQKSVLSFQKSQDGSVTVSGMAVETKIENVFICESDDIIVSKDAESHECPECGTNMMNIGWFEAGPDRAEKVKGIVTKFKNPSTGEDNANSDEGGVNVFTKNKDKNEDKEVGIVNPSEEHPDGEKIEESDEVSVPADDSGEVVETTETDEDAQAPEEVEDDESRISKKIDELHEAVKNSLEESKNETLEKVAELETKVEQATQSFLEKANELESKIGQVDEKLETSKQRLIELESSLEKMNASEAIRKSADLEESPVKVVKKETSWNGAFSGRSRRGFSVDDMS